MIFVSSCSCHCPIYWSQVLSREWTFSWSNADRRCSNYIWVINNFIAYYSATYVRGLTVVIIFTCMAFQGNPWANGASTSHQVGVTAARYCISCHVRMSKGVWRMRIQFEIASGSKHLSALSNGYKITISIPGKLSAYCGTRVSIYILQNSYL